MGKFVILMFWMLLLSHCAQSRDQNGFNDFTVYSKENIITIQWKAQKTALNNEYNYCIQRSHDGVNFETIICVLDHGFEPEIEEFIETDFDPLPGWSFYRVLKLDGENKIEQTPLATVFYGVDRVSKGKLIAPKQPTTDEVETLDLSLFANTEYVFVLRGADCQEYFIKSNLSVSENDLLSIYADSIIPRGIYRIASCSNQALIGLSLSVVE